MSADRTQEESMLEVLRGSELQGVSACIRCCLPLYGKFNSGGLSLLSNDIGTIVDIGNGSIHTV